VATSAASALATTGLAATPVLLVGHVLVAPTRLGLLNLGLRLRDPLLKIGLAMENPGLRRTRVDVVPLQHPLVVTEFLLKCSNGRRHLLSTQDFPVQAAASSATAYGFDIHSLELIAYLDNAFIDIHATWKLNCFAGFANRIELINQCFEFSL